jgi:hypothetical protein
MTFVSFTCVLFYLLDNEFSQTIVHNESTNSTMDSSRQQSSPLSMHLSTDVRIGFRCPLTNYNSYGLLPSHGVRICAPNKSIRHLLEHFRNYHCLNADYANALMQAIMLNRDPLITKIFPMDTNITIRDDRHPCPLHDTPKTSGIRCAPCPSQLTEKSIRSHLKTVHRLPSAKIKRLLETN